MRNRSSKPGPEDANETAFRVVSAAYDDPAPEKEAPEEGPKKNPAAVELGKLGGLKGGKARAAKLSPEERVSIAKRAAEARWKAKE